MTTAQQYRTTVAVAGRTIGVFDTFSGGGVTAAVTKRRPGGMEQQKTNAAMPEYDDVTVGRQIERPRDTQVRAQLLPLVGRAGMVVSQQPLDDYGAPFGKPEVFTGRLMAMTNPDGDSESTDTSMFELTMAVTSRT